MVSTASIATTVMNLIEFPEERAKLIRDPSPGKMKVAVEEFIRWVTPILNMRRTATRRHVLHGQTIEEGDELLLMYSSANRDPEQFDDPDRYDVTRDCKDSLAFGRGIHFCLGAALARLEAKISLEEILGRAPAYEIDESGLVRIHSGNVRGFAEIPFRMA